MENVMKTNNKQKRVQLGSTTIIILTAALFLLLSVTTKNFLTYDNIYSILFGVSIQFFTAIGFTLLMIMGEIDMSVGAMYGFSGALTGVFTEVLDIPFIAAFILTLLICTLIGWFTGFIIVRFRLNSMMVTIGMMTVLAGMKAVMIDNLGATVFSSSYRNFIKVKFFNIHWSIYAMLLIIVVLEILLVRSRHFRQMYFIGQHLDTAKLYGVKAEKVKHIAFVASAALSGLGGIMSGARLNHAASTAGDGVEFTIVTAAVLGGASLFGGKGSVLRTALGLLFLSILSNGMIAYGIDPYIQQIINGIILIAAVLADILLSKRAAKKA